MRHAPSLTAAVIAAAMLVSVPASAAPPSNLARALADPGRAAQRGTDARRHPAELVALADLKPGQQILDLIPGDGYWTRIFSKMVGPRGRVYAVWPQAYAREATGNIQQLQGIARQYGNVTVQVQPSTALTAPEPLDVVWTADNYHDYNDKFMGSPGSLVLRPLGIPDPQAGRAVHRHRPCGRTRPRRPRHRHPAPDRARGGCPPGRRGRVPAGRREPGAAQSQRPADDQGVRPPHPRSHQPVRAEVPQAPALKRCGLSRRASVRRARPCATCPRGMAWRAAARRARCA